MKKILLYILIAAVAVIELSAARNPKVQPSYAWTISQPLGMHYLSTIDTLLYNYYQQSIPSAGSPAYAITGNYGTEGQNQIFIPAAFHVGVLF